MKLDIAKLNALARDILRLWRAGFLTRRSLQRHIEATRKLIQALSADQITAFGFDEADKEFWDIK